MVLGLAIIRISAIETTIHAMRGTAEDMQKKKKEKKRDNTVSTQ